MKDGMGFRDAVIAIIALVGLGVSFVLLGACCSMLKRSIERRTNKQLPTFTCVILPVFVAAIVIGVVATMMAQH
jgi:hypothetical protein